MRVQRLPGAKASRPNVRLYVADDIRQEVGGKVTLVGLFADNVVVIDDDRPSEASDQGGKPATLLLDSLSFLINVSGLTGRQNVEITFADLLTKMGPIERVGDFGEGEMSANFIVKFRPLAMTTTGVKRVFVDVAGEHHELRYEFRPRVARAIEEPTRRPDPKRQRQARPSARAKKKVREA